MINATDHRVGEQALCWSIILHTEMPEIETAPIKIDGTPPTAQTPRSNWLIFWLETPHGNDFRGTEAIFEFQPGS